MSVESLREVTRFIEESEQGRPLDQLADQLQAILRTGGAGSLDLAWVAAGRLVAWVQREPEPWDWLPGALLVREAGGRAEVLAGGWHVAGAPALVDAIGALVSRSEAR